jgi:RNA polymerase sigma factor (sigma-70 family)
MYPSEADLALLRRFSDHRDEEAFAEIVRRYAAVVYGTCRRIVGDSARAEDVSQETFFRLLRKPEAVTKSLGGWLHRAATQLAIDAVRRDSARRKRELNVARSRSKQQHVSQWDELSPLIDQALADLPEQTRTLLVRHFLQGTSQAALAVEHLTSAATISRRIRAGLDALRIQLQKKGMMVAAAALASLLVQGKATAAPAALVSELGKMALISGAPPELVGIASSAAATKTVSTALVWALCLAVAAVLLITLVGIFTSGAEQKLTLPANQPEQQQ